MMLGLRRTGGITRQEFKALVGRPIDAVYGAQLERGAARGSIVVDADRIRLVDPLLASAATVLFV
jgi:hypothetical protein